MHKNDEHQIGDCDLCDNSIPVNLYILRDAEDSETFDVFLCKSCIFKLWNIKNIHKEFKKCRVEYNSGLTREQQTDNLINLLEKEKSKMTNYTKTFTGNQIALILQKKDILRNLNSKILGIHNSTKLYKFLIKCTDLYNGMVKALTDTMTQQNDDLVNAHPEHADLLKMFVTIRHDMVACNKFINEHKELEAFVPEMEANNKAIVELQNRISESAHELPFSIEKDKLEKALESQELSVEELYNLMTVFGFTD